MVRASRRSRARCALAGWMNCSAGRGGLMEGLRAGRAQRLYCGRGSASRCGSRSSKSAYALVLRSPKLFAAPSTAPLVDTSIGLVGRHSSWPPPPRLIGTMYASAHSWVAKVVCVRMRSSHPSCALSLRASSPCSTGWWSYKSRLDLRTRGPRERLPMPLTSRLSKALCPDRP